MRLTQMFRDFFNSEKAGGLILIITTAISLLLANSAWGLSYIGFWERPVGSHSITHWINDGLMAIFFLLIGLELKREIFLGELSDIKRAALPIFGAIGGMVVPAGIYLFITSGTPYTAGAGIPMATDIAFAIGILSLLGNRVPLALKVFLTALAVIDDLGAILVIALFYSKGLAFGYLAAALGILAVLFVLKRFKVYALWPYLLGGVVMWYFMLHSGIHATITGVLLAFTIPFGDGGNGFASYKLQHFLHQPVALFILPVFAMANTAILIPDTWADGLLGPGSIGIMAGLVIGKPLGILLFSVLGVGTNLCLIPKGVRWAHVGAVGFLAGIGFTMSIFITILAFTDQPQFIDSSKIAILISSLIAAVVGYFMLHLTLKYKKPKDHCAEVDAKNASPLSA